MEKLREEVALLRDEVAHLTPDPGPHIGPTARIDPSADIDPRCVMPSRYQASAIVVGAHTKLFRGAEWLGPVTVGREVFINRDSYIRPQTTIGDRVSLGPFVRFVSDTHELGSATARRRTGTPHVLPISIGAGTWIGASTTVLGGVTIGEMCVIAAGSVVVSDIPDNSLAGGVPAKVIRELA